jgi:hypothetical protein
VEMVGRGPAAARRCQVAVLGAQGAALRPGLREAARQRAVLVRREGKLDIAWHPMHGLAFFFHAPICFFSMIPPPRLHSSLPVWSTLTFASSSVSPFPFMRCIICMVYLDEGMEGILYLLDMKFQDCCLPLITTRNWLIATIIELVFTLFFLSVLALGCYICFV